MQRGDIYHVNLNPIAGKEQAGARYVIIVSPKEFNVLGTPIVCPISLGGNFARERGFAVPLMGANLKAQGVVLCHHPRALDLNARQAKFVEKASQDVIDEILSKLAPIFE